MLSSIVKLTRILLEVLGKGGNQVIKMLLHLKIERKPEEKKMIQPTLIQIVLTIGASNSFSSKRQMDTVMCLKGIPRINHWGFGAAT